MFIVCFFCRVPFQTLLRTLNNVFILLGRIHNKKKPLRPDLKLPEIEDCPDELISLMVFFFFF